MNKKQQKTLLKGVFDFLESATFSVKTGFDSDGSSDSDTNENIDYFDTENSKKKFDKWVQESPAIKMEFKKENKYYLSIKNLKRKKIF